MALLKVVLEAVPRERDQPCPGIEIPNAQVTAKPQKLGVQIPLHQGLGLGLPPPTACHSPLRAALPLVAPPQAAMCNPGGLG